MNIPPLLFALLCVLASIGLFCLILVGAFTVTVLLPEKWDEPEQPTKILPFGRQSVRIAQPFPPSP
ncbi:MAG TPA: hypothetical protein VFV38_33405 [Ktedonobacteraceae bacterium]|nr:hypothetical protein [Ktedonobacteraceae bacterium]